MRRQVKDMRKLVPLMEHKPEFLFEAAQCLSKSERFEEANRLLERAMKLSGDPMIHYMAAKNEQSMGNYQKSGKFIAACDRYVTGTDLSVLSAYQTLLGTRILSKRQVPQSGKCRTEKEPKVKSTAIREMREEVKILIQNRK